MTYNPAIHNRHSIRLQGYDYTQSGAYFITINTYKKEHLFGEIVDGVVQLTPIGKIAFEQWEKIPANFPNVLLDAFVIMPNHMHGIVVITEGEVVEGKGKAFDYRFSENNRTSLNNPFNLNSSEKLGSNALPIQKTTPPRLGSTPGSLPAIVQNYKSVTSRKINKLMKTPGTTIWHRNFVWVKHLIMIYSK